MSSMLNYVLQNSKDALGYMYQMLPQSTIRTTANQTSVVNQATPKMDISLLTSKLGSSWWIKIAAISGATAVVLGAYGAHGLKLSAEKRAIYETASKYHFYHTIGLLAVPMMKRPNLVGALFLGETCRSYLTETIPKDLVFNQTIDSKDTHDQFLKLINSAKYSIDIASFYWTLLGKDVMPENPVPESKKGEDVLNALINVAKTKSIKIRIAVNDDKNSRNNQDLNLLEPITEIRRINFTRLVGAGILHTKFILVDNQSFYLGSTNMDWRSLTHVKELGITSYDCSPIAQDLANIFSVYWYLGVNTYVTIPDHWPNEYSVNYNLSNQQEVQLNTETYKVYLSSSPKELCPDGRTNDIDSILSIINSAEKYIYIAVMDYFPIFLYKRPTSYWPTIDDALRRAAVERKVQIRLLASHWNHTRPSMKIFLKSLEAFVNDRDISGSIETRLFQVPTLTPEEKNIPFARVNHNKYMVTDKVAYIGTSNWSADYFVSTGGVGLALTPTINHKTSFNLHEQIRKIFERDWNSKYSQIV